MDTFISTPNADPNADGLINLAAYAFGISPLTGSGAPLPRADRSGTKRSFIYQKNSTATDVSFPVEHTSDLSDEFSWGDITTTDSIMGTSGSLRTNKAVLPASANPIDFYRLRLELSE